MKRYVQLAAAALLMSAPGALAAEQDSFMIATGGDLAALCDAAPADANYAASIQMCQGFIVGVNQFHEAWKRAGGDEGIYCLPDVGAPSRNEAAAAYAAWLPDAPGAADLPAVEALVRWAKTTYPCK